MAAHLTVRAVHVDHAVGKLKFLLEIDDVLLEDISEAHQHLLQAELKLEIMNLAKHFKGNFHKRKF